MIRIEANTRRGQEKLARIARGMAPANIDRVVERAALEGLAFVIEDSPKKWFGQIRSGWRISKPQNGVRILDIPESLRTVSGTASVADIARMVNYGTANDGQGFIYPTDSKALYIPLTRRAATGWREGLVYGVDYILRRRVHGIRGRHFIEAARLKAMVNFRNLLLAYVRRLVNMTPGNG